MSLYIVSTPIGHPDDITKRAIDTLKQVEFVICEEIKEGSRLLKKIGIEKPLYTLNEHNEAEHTPEIQALLISGKNGALISDCGTPLFADPGKHLVQACHEKQIRVIPIPGASSLMATLVVAGVDLNQFYYAGFLPREKTLRKEEIGKLMHFTCPVIIYDTPYRLNALLQDLSETLPSARKITLAMNLTQPDEEILHNTIKKIWDIFSVKKVKKEFVIILEPVYRAPPPQKPFKKKKKRS